MLAKVQGIHVGTRCSLGQHMCKSGGVVLVRTDQEVVREHARASVEAATHAWAPLMTRVDTLGGSKVHHDASGKDIAVPIIKSVISLPKRLEATLSSSRWLFE